MQVTAESDDVIGFTKTVQHSIKNISINIGAVFFKLGTRTVHHRISKMTLSCCCHDNSYAVGSPLIKTKIPRFYLKQGSFTCNKLMRSFKTIWESCVFRATPSVPVKKMANGDIWFFTERDWSQDCCHGNNIVGFILFLLGCTFLVPSLKNTAPICLEIILIECSSVLVKPPMTLSLPSFA